MNIIWQWWRFNQDTGEIERGSTWNDLTDVHMHTIREDDLQPNSYNGDVHMWVGAVYNEAMCISFTNPEAFYAAIKEMKKNDSFR